VHVEGQDVIAAVAAAAARDVPTVTRAGEALPGPIDGVVVERVRVLADNRGTLAPFLDIRDDFWREPVVYAYLFTIRPGVIKGWGMHEHQTDRYFVASGLVRVALFDGREESPTRGNVHEVYFTPQTTGAISIPAGVWHADHNWGETDALIVNFPTRPYDPDDPDKHRIDPHAGVIPFDWSLRDG
jgi:dTDP-4-dehydrorhamnose 3,5-epimerase